MSASSPTASLTASANQENKHHEMFASQKLNPDQPSYAVLDSTGSASEYPQPLRASVDPAQYSVAPANDPSLMSICAQLSSIRTPSTASSSQARAHFVDNICSSPTGATQGSADPSILQLESLPSASSIPDSQTSHASASASLNGSVMPAELSHAQLEARDSSVAAATDPSSLQEGRHTESGTDLVSEPACRSASADVLSEPALSSADGVMVSEPALSSADGVMVSEPGSSSTVAKSPKAGRGASSRTPHVNSPAVPGKSSVSESPTQELPASTSPLQVTSAEADSPGTSEAGVGTDAILGPVARSSAEFPEAGVRTDPLPEPSTAGCDGPQAEHLSAGVGTNVVPRPSTAGSARPHSEHPEAGLGTDAVHGPRKAEPQTERQCSSAAASTSGADEAAPEMARHGRRLRAQKGIPIT